MKATAHAPINRPDTYQRLPTARPHLRTAAGPYIRVETSQLDATYPRVIGPGASDSSLGRGKLVGSPRFAPECHFREYNRSSQHGARSRSTILIGCSM